MTLNELAKEYRTNAAVLQARIHVLQAELHSSPLCEMEKLRLRIRIEALQRLRREANETAVYLEHYYDRRYRRHGRFAI